MVLIFTAGNRHLFKVIFFKLKSAWILLILAAERGGGEDELACPVFVHLTGPAPERCWLPTVWQDRGPRLLLCSVLSTLAPALAGQNPYLIFSIILRIFQLQR